MRPLLTRVAPFLTFFLWGCAALDSESPELLAQLNDFEVVEHRQNAFLASPDALPNLEDMRTYAAEIDVLYETESLRLGPLGSALLSKFDASLYGHLVLTKFYAALDETAAADHQVWVNRIRNHTSHQREGTLESPYRALTLEDAHAYIRQRGDSVIGEMYGQSDNYPLVAYILAKNPNGYVDKVYFEIKAFESYRELTDDPANAEPADVIRELARQQVNAAQVAYGIYLIENAGSDAEKHKQILATGRQWLRTARSRQNALPHYFLGNLAVENRHDGISWDAVKQNYERAIQLGYTDAHVSLARLYLQAVYGDAERRTGLNLLEEAAEKGNASAAAALGALLISQAPDDAIAYLKQAAESGSARYQLGYIRTLTQPQHDRQLGVEELQWLKTLAEEDKNQEAMILLGTIYAKGLYDDKVKMRQARRWYRRSVEVMPDNGQNVNEVAWVLATTHIKRLRNPSLAVKYMDELMAKNEAARNSPAYMDTWAAAYAAVGDFQRAIELQEQAVAIAAKTASNVRPILEAHLQHYKDRQALTEQVP